jgi:hypothetical protein
MFEPWIGKHYRDTGLLLLGESSYSWEVDGRKVSPSPQHPQDLVHDIVANFKHQGLGFMRTLTRGLTNDESPSAERSCCVWEMVSFTNYVSVVVGDGPRQRPTAGQWETAKTEFPRLLDLLNPSRIVVLGGDLWDHMPPATYGDGRGAQAYRLQSGELCWCLPLPHPSRGLSWKLLAATIYFVYAGQLLETWS